MEFTLKLFTKLDSYRLATFIICIGTEALNMHSGLPCASNVEKGGIDEVFEMWNNYCVGKTKTIFKR